MLDNENEPVTDSGLAFGYWNQCILRRLSIDSGAGANAGSMIHMTFVAPEPLSELVWSGDKGPSNVTLSPPQSNMGGNFTTDKPIDEENFLTPQASLQLRSGVSGTDMTASPTRDGGINPVCVSSGGHEIGTGGNVKEVKTAVEVSVPCTQEGVRSLIDLQVDEIPETKEKKSTTFSGNVEREGVDIFLNESNKIIPSVQQNEPVSGDPADGGEHAGVGNRKMEIDFSLTSKVHPANEKKASGDPVASQTPQAGRPLTKLEATAENDLKGEHAFGAMSQILGPECTPNVIERCEQDDKILPGNNCVRDKHSPTNSRINIPQSKGKEKVLSDGDLSGNMSEDEDDSHESVESCNSARLVSSGNKRWRFEEEFIVESKRFRKKIQETPACRPYVRQDSSFMNWISNMVNGFSKSMQDEAPSLALALAHPDHGHDDPDKKLMACNQDAGGKNIGFRSMFESLYCSKAEHQETRMLTDDHELVEIPTQLEPATTQKTYHGGNINLDRGFLLSVQTFNKSISANNVRSGIHPNSSSTKAAGSHETGHTNSSEKRNAGNLPFPIKTYEVSSNSSVRKRKNESADNVECSPQSEERTTGRFGRSYDLLGNLWITRFTPKTVGPSLMSDHYNKNANGVLECSNDHKSLGAKEQSPEDLVIVIGNDLQNRVAVNEGSVAVNRNDGQNDQKSMPKLNHVLSSPNLRDSDAMASVFARRLDALKHITPSGAAGTVVHETVTCLFCGMKGHRLRECSKIRDTELQEFLSNLKSYTGAEYLPCFCIKCSESSHWAIACPNVPSTRQPQLENNAFCSDYYCCPSEVKIKSGNDGNVTLLLTGKENQFQASVAHAFCDGVVSRMDTDLNLSWKANEISASEKMRYCSNSVKKYSASGSVENKLKDNQIMPSSQFVNNEISNVPRGIFDSINRLRLSRTDVLKWMKSHSSLSQLEGFFLRLRLGKWEEGLGGTGYYVSCLTGFPRESCPQNVKNSIAVVVGGRRCLVESQYVSNHDFLEEELKTWWSATSKGSGKIPSDEDLKEKVKRKKMLGL